MVAYLIRFLASSIDIIVGYLLVELMMSQLGMVGNTDLLAQIFYVLYGVITSLSFEGKTVGRYFGKLHLCFQRPDLASLSIMTREVAKMLYFLPGWLGVVILLASVGCFLLTGRFIHDYLGQTQVKGSLERA